MIIPRSPDRLVMPRWVGDQGFHEAASLVVWREHQHQIPGLMEVQTVA